jgi:hypothetical protein
MNETLLHKMRKGKYDAVEIGEVISYESGSYQKVRSADVYSASMAPDFPCLWSLFGGGMRELYFKGDPETGEIGTETEGLIFPDIETFLSVFEYGEGQIVRPRRG